MTSQEATPSQELGLNSSKSETSGEQDDNSLEKQLADYGLPPPDYALSNHYFHYGWPITPQMMHRMLVRLKLPPPQYIDSTTAVIVGFLGRLANFRYCIRFVSCKPDEWCEDKKRVETYMDENGKEVRVVAFLSIGSTMSTAYFFRRPSQKGLNAMIKAFGGEKPRWMEELSTKKEAREPKGRFF